MDDSRIKDTWDELGFKIRPTSWTVMVRTDPVPEKVGLIWIPPDSAMLFNRELPHMKLVTATVLAVGPKAKMVKVGDRVVFKRVHFAWLWQLADKTYVGYLPQEELVGHPEDGAIESLVCNSWAGAPASAG